MIFVAKAANSAQSCENCFTFLKDTLGMWFNLMEENLNRVSMIDAGGFLLQLRLVHRYLNHNLHHQTDRVPGSFWRELAVLATVFACSGVILGT